MALSKPILNSVVAWDVANGCTFTFNVIGGDAVVGNILYILDNDSGTVVYTLSTTSFQYRAIVPSNPTGLVNGGYYSAYLVTKNSNNEYSENSNTIQFYCYSTPTWAFTNFSSGTIVTNSSIAPIVHYNQAQDETLNDYTILLYNANQAQLATSGVQYVSSALADITVSYNFYGLEDDTTYNVRAIGHTAEGTPLDTGYIRFVVNYEQPETYRVLNLTNNCQEGYIVYQSSGYIIQGQPTGDYSFTDNGIDLTNDGSKLTWTNGVNSYLDISGDFTLKAWFTNAVPADDFVSSEALIQLYDEDSENMYKVFYITSPVDDTKHRVVVIVSENYWVYSEDVYVQDDDELCLQIRRINNIYEVLLDKVGG